VSWTSIVDKAAIEEAFATYRYLCPFRKHVAVPIVNNNLFRNTADAPLLCFFTLIEPYANFSPYLASILVLLTGLSSYAGGADSDARLQCQRELSSDALQGNQEA
jgi:hypothetical protein